MPAARLMVSPGAALSIAAWIEAKHPPVPPTFTHEA
jgi:hypothetical protein